MDEAVDSARQSDEDAEVGDRLDLAGDLVALLVVHREVVPRVRHALLHAERDPAALLVDLEDHHLDFVAELHDLGRMDVLVGPVHFRDVDEPFDPGLDLDERAVVGDVGDLAEEARAGRVAARQADPRVLAELLHAERDAVLFLVELEDLRGDLVADRQDFRRVLDAAPCEVGDVQQAVDAAEIDERAVVGDVLDDALDGRAFLQRRQELLALLAEARLEHGAARDDDVVALAVELDDLELERLVLERRRVLDRTDVDERSGEERANAVDHHGEAALHLAGDEAGDDRALLHRGLEVVPGLEALRLVARELGLAVAVLEALDGDGDEIAGLDLDLALVVLEFLDRDEALGLEARVDDDDVVVDADDFCGDQLALAHLLPREGFLEQRGEVFVLGGVAGCNAGRGGSHRVRFLLSSNRRGREPCFSRGGLVVESARETPAKALADGPASRTGVRVRYGASLP